MNIPILAAGALSLFAFLAHSIVGDKEYIALKPIEAAPAKTKETWIQVRSGWHWVSVDLLLSSIILFLIATTEIIKAKEEISFLLSVYFFICGLIWLVTVLLSKSNNKQILALGQWIFCFLMSGLIFAGT